MKLVTSQQMQAIDRQAIEVKGIPGLELMENAGRGIADYIRTLFPSEVKAKRFAIICGRGNNGGDGFVIARYLHQWGCHVDVLVLARTDEIKGDALENYHRLKPHNLRIFEVAETKAIPDLSTYDLLIDAIFGTGFKGSVDGLNREVIEFLNNVGVSVLSVDTPSGLNNDTGHVGSVCVKANHTATLALPKVGQFFYPGRSYRGELGVIDIGIPQSAIDAVDVKINLVTEELVRKLIPDRPPTAHKGDCGRLFIVAGSVGMTGAAALAADSAMRSGAGLVYVGVPKSLNDILEVKLTEALTKPLPELRSKRCLPVRALGPILENIKQVDAVCLGPGVGRHFETVELFQRIISRLEKPAVLDADGLFPFSGKPELLAACKADLILTPHVGEYARLTGSSLSESPMERIDAVIAYAKLISKVVLLKGAPTIVASPDGQAYVSATGNPGMATGGSGDVLTGLIGALLALGLKGVDAAICGAYIHGLAGDLAQKEVGTFGLIASDIARYLPQAFLVIKV